MKIGSYCCLTADILRNVPLPNILILSKRLNLIGYHSNQKVRFAKKYSKVISSEGIKGMKLKLYRNVHNISLYKRYVFYCDCLCAFVGMLTYSFHWLKMGKMKIGIYCSPIAGIWAKVLQKCSLKSPLPSIWILSKLLNLIGCHGNRKAELAKKYRNLCSCKDSPDIWSWYIF